MKVGQPNIASTTAASTKPASIRTSRVDVALHGLGYCFAKMLHYLAKEELEKYSNRLYSFKSHYTINLNGEEDRGEVGSDFVSTTDLGLHLPAGGRSRTRRTR